MQTEVPTLPVVHLNANKNLNRKQNPDLRSSTVEKKTCSPCKNVALLSSNKKCLHPLLGGPYRSNVRQQYHSDQSKVNKNSVGQRVLSAKMLRVKELQNQLADAHYHLNELANENRLLKALQKRQDSALKRYEGTNAELPRIIHSHHEELRVLQIKYKKLRALHKETCESLKEKENELQCLQSQNKHLLQLSKDRNLGEREKLQLQVSDLSYRIQQQQETIQALHRKLTLESKSLKHQLHMEISKRKETQKNLDETVEKLKGLENLLDNRERRLYSNGQLSVRNNNERLGTQSLTNLRDISTSHLLKLSGRDKKCEEDLVKHNLPVLGTSEVTEDENVTKINSNEITDSAKTETMANLQQIRKYRLQKSSKTHRSSLSDDLGQKSKESKIKLTGDLQIAMHIENPEDVVNLSEEDIVKQYEVEAGEFRKIFENRKFHCYNELPKELKTEVDCSSESTDSEDENKNFEDRYHANVAKSSRELHARLISSTDEVSDVTAKEVQFSNRKYKNKVSISEQVDEGKDSSGSDSELDCEIRRVLNKRVEHQNNSFKPISSKYNTEAYFKPNEDIGKTTEVQNRQVSKETNYTIFNGSQTCRNIITEMQKENKRISDNNHLHNFESITDSKKNRSTTDDEINRLWYDIEHNDKHYTDTVSPSSKVYDLVLDSKEHALNQIVPTDHETSEETSNSMEYEIKLMPERKCSMEEYQQLEAQFGICNEVKDRIAPKSKIQTHKEERSGNSDNEVADSVETRNKFNKQEEETENIKVLPNVACAPTELQDTSIEVDRANELNNKGKISAYNKEMLLATMKAIDDNENIEYLNQEYPKRNAMSRKQITENLFRGLPTQTKTKQDIIKDIFEAENIENKPKSSYSKLH